MWCAVSQLAWFFLPIAVSVLCGCSPAVVTSCWQLVLCKLHQLRCTMPAMRWASSVSLGCCEHRWWMAALAYTFSKSWGKSQLQRSRGTPDMYVGGFNWHCWYSLIIISEAYYLSWLWTYFIAGDELQCTDHHGYDGSKYASCQPSVPQWHAL